MDLKSEAPPFDLDQLKQKYLHLIDQRYHDYQTGKTTLRHLHHELSMAVRYFVYEVRYFPAPKLTLSDFRRAPFPALTKVIEMYYEKEFALVEHGDPGEAVEAAKDMVRRWV